MKKKLLLFMIPILLVSTNVFATGNQKQDDIITKTIVINKSEENNFLNLLEQSIEEQGIKYNLENMDKQELETTDTKTVEEFKTLELSTNNKNQILNKFAQSVLYNDGEYKGELYALEDSLEIQTIKNGKYEKVDIIEKEYNNLDEADLDYIPKEITQNGYIYVLTKCDWKIAENENISNISVPKLYTATTTYKTVKTLEYPYTYKCKLKYTGEVSKTTLDTIQYTINYKQEEQKEEIKEDKTSILPYLGGTGVFLVVIFFLLPNAKIMNYYNGKYQTIKHIRVSSRNPKVNLKNLPKARTNAISIKFNDRLTKKLGGKTVTIITPKATYQKMIMNKSIEVHL